MKSTSDQADSKSIETYHLYVKCPTVQHNISRSSFPDADRMRKDFPSFQASLKQGGNARFTAKGFDNSNRNNIVKWNLLIAAEVEAR